ncbi:mitochondrial 54S ribosomal protein YmL35 [Arthroderma uncinatum]|uniref:mitochondrial 54S ribosomal protein YmL35 n=1 Tax=Arthroderma uncinatum TaxID=74035 RepID=UPI00144A56A4|nr:mitochondrial 54S ribosomal protein YmL35 [Arthroderma uncinatum]KAF3483417.1 mitochondrial 54S ribosomal protein YmL35 [Arthroderma uncinatum]
MAHCEAASKPILQCLRQAYRGRLAASQLRLDRPFSSTAAAATDAEAQPAAPKQPFYRTIDPELVSSPRLERKLIRAGKFPIGSRRRRIALQGSPNHPFEQLPFQCFQEARKVLQEDREEKIQQIEKERARLARLREADPATVGGEAKQQARIKSMEKHLEELKILADINDPLVKKRFEDGLGDMSRPIYRHLANRKWREYRRLILIQRLTQMKVIPDVLAHANPIVDVKLFFGKKPIQPGVFVDSRVSMLPPNIDIQSFDKGEKLVTIAVVDPDIPNMESDTFDSKVNFLAVNIPISPTSTFFSLGDLPESQVVLPWAAPYALKGSPYHRLSVFVMEQKDQKPLDPKAVAEKITNRDGLRLRTLETRHQLKPIGASLFRTQWDDNMEAVMRELEVEGADIELKRKRVEPLPYKRRNPAAFR